MIGIGVDTTGSTPLPIDARRGRSRWIRDGARTSPRTRGCGRTTRARRRRRRSPRCARAARAALLAPIGGTYSSEWWWSKIWHCLKVAPDVFDAAASWVELADFVPAVLAGVREPEGHRPLRLRGGPQGDVFRRVGRPAVEGVPRALDPKLAASCVIALYERAHAAGTPAGHLCREWATFGLREGHPDRDGRVRRALRRRRVGRPARHARQDHRHVDLRLRDRAAATTRRRPRHPGHLRHRERLDHAGLLRHRSGAVGGRRHPELVGRRRVPGRRALHTRCRASRGAARRASRG